jgi:hypothetical protein
MDQLGSMLRAVLKGRRDAVSLGSSSLVDWLLDLLTIFRRPVPVPVKARRPIR